MAVLAVLCGALFFHGLNTGELYRTENLRALVAAEFLRTGNWSVPTLFGQPLLTKPPGTYAAITAASYPFGRVSDATARLPSALAASAIVFLFYWYVARQVGRCGGAIAAAIVPCSALWLEKSVSAEIDMLHVAWVAAALLFFFRAVECDEKLPGDRPAGMPALLWWWLASLCMAAGTLTKWSAPVFFYAAAVPFLSWRGKLRLLLARGHLTASALAAAVCISWVWIAVEEAGWGLFYQTLRAEALTRLSYRHHAGDHTLALSLLHPVKVMAVNLPWSPFALLVLCRGFLAASDERRRRLVQAFYCWTWPNLLICTLLPDHATRHSFALFPGIAGLAAMSWLAFLEKRLPPKLAEWHSRLAIAALAGLAAAVFAGSALLARVDGPSAPLLVFISAASAGVLVLGMRASRKAEFGRVLACIIALWVALKVGYVESYVQLRNGARQARARGELLERKVPAGEILYAFKYRGEGMLFYYGRPVLRLRGPQDLPGRSSVVYCLLIPEEWSALQKNNRWRPVAKFELQDEQRRPVVLAALAPRAG